jgi:hypothetical protein
MNRKTAVLALALLAGSLSTSPGADPTQQPTQLLVTISGVTSPRADYMATLNGQHVLQLGHPRGCGRWRASGPLGNGDRWVTIYAGHERVGGVSRLWVSVAIDGATRWGYRALVHPDATTWSGVPLPADTMRTSTSPCNGTASTCTVSAL